MGPLWLFFKAVFGSKTVRGHVHRARPVIGWNEDYVCVIHLSETQLNLNCFVKSAPQKP